MTAYTDFSYVGLHRLTLVLPHLKPFSRSSNSTNLVGLKCPTQTIGRGRWIPHFALNLIIVNNDKEAAEELLLECGGLISIFILFLDGGWGYQFQYQKHLLKKSIPD